jgi:hypothetical protein
MTKMEVDALIQKKFKGKNPSASDNGDTRTCFNCGESGRIAPNCPKPKKASQNSKSLQSRTEKSGWKKVPPTAGTSETKVSGKLTWFWCAHCKCWRTTHGTSGHISNLPEGNKGNETKPSANLLSTQYDVETGTWCASARL